MLRGIYALLIYLKLKQQFKHQFIAKWTLYIYGYRFIQPYMYRSHRHCNPKPLHQSPLPSGKSCLEKHPDDGHHGQTAVCQLCIKLGFLHFWVIRCDELPSKVSSKGCGSRGLVLGNFAEGHVCQNLCPSCSWHFGNCRKAIGNICKLQAGRWRQEAREFSCNFWGDVSHGCKHRNSAMLDFCGTTALEVLNAAITGEPCWVPKTHGSLHTEFILKGTQRRGSVVGPVAPSTASQSILLSREGRF